MAATLDRTAPAERDAWADDLAPGTTFAGYRIEAVAGRGGMGVVYKAIQLGLDRPVAIKVIAAGLLGDPRVRERFLREAHAAAAIEHPNVIPIHGAGEHLGRPFIVMRFVDGDDLRQRIRLDGPLAPGQAAELVAALAAALDAAHEAGVVHRDVKPANILLDGHGHAYLTDFGLARHTLSDAGLTAPGAWVGTLDFVAPEQIRGERIDGRVDVYALGCVLHFALTGQVPYPRETDEARLWAHLHAVAPAPSRAAAGVPAAFDDVVARALAKEPEGRPPSAGALGAAALTAAGGAPAGRTAQAGRTPGSATWADAPRRRPLRRVSRAVAVVAASAAAGAALAVVLAGRGQDRPATAASTATTATGRPARHAPRPGRPDPRWWPRTSPARFASPGGRSTSRWRAAARGSRAPATRRSGGSRRPRTTTVPALAWATGSRTSRRGAGCCGSPSPRSGRSSRSTPRPGTSRATRSS